MAANSGGSAPLRRALVDELARTGSIRTPAVRRGFLKVPRELFVPEIARRDGLERVYRNEALMTRMPDTGLPTSSSSQPSIMAVMLEELRLRPGMRVLEVGAGTGYNAALLSLLVGRRGRVTSVELQWDLADKAAKALRSGGYAVEVLVGDAQHARFGSSPFDRVILTASTDHVPPLWLEELVPGGLIEMPLRLGPPGPYQQVVATFERDGDRLRSVSVVGGGFMNLRSAGDGGAGEDTNPTLSVNERVDGRYHVYGSLTGPGLAKLKPGARRRLAALLAGPARQRSFAVREGRSSLLALAALSQPEEGVVVGHHSAAAAGIGIAATDGRSLAVLVPDLDPSRCRLVQYGDVDGRGLLDGILTQWRAAGRPTLADWSIEVTFGDLRPEAPIVLRRRDCWFAVSFRRLS